MSNIFFFVDYITFDTKQGNIQEIPNPRLSSSFIYTLDNSRLNTSQRQLYEENGFIVVKNLVPEIDLKKYELVVAKYMKIILKFL